MVNKSKFRDRKSRNKEEEIEEDKSHHTAAERKKKKKKKYSSNIIEDGIRAVVGTARKMNRNQG